MKNKNATKANPSSAINNQINSNKKTRKAPLKIELCLIELLKRGEAGLMELEALQAYGETALHSTISTLANSKGLVFKRQQHSHEHQQRGKVYFMRYSLVDPEQISKAKALLSYYQSKRGLEVAA